MTLFRSIAAFALLSLTAAPALAKVPKVVVSIAPIHSLVAAVMGDVATPTLLIPGGASPHAYALKPSDAQALNDADLVVWIGPELEAMLQKPLANLATNANTIQVATMPGITTLPARDPDAWMVYGHSHGHKPSAAIDQAEAEHAHGPGIDPHLWLDPANAKVLVRSLSKELGRLDPDNANAYRSNAITVTKVLADLDRALKMDLGEAGHHGVIVFHDAYQYLEKAYELAVVGIVAISPGRPPGAGRIARLRDQLQANQIVCAFSEPQFPPALIASLVEGTATKIAALDPMGADIPPGPDLYPTLLRRNSEAIRACLGLTDG